MSVVGVVSSSVVAGFLRRVREGGEGARKQSHRKDKSTPHYRACCMVKVLLKEMFVLNKASGAYDTIDNTTTKVLYGSPIREAQISKSDQAVM